VARAAVAKLASQLSEAQLRQACEAAGTTPQEVTSFIAKLVERIAARRGLDTGP
jgi:hypothetical protein